MARLSREESARRGTEKALKLTLEIKNLNEKYYNDLVDEYMEYYDNIKSLNKRIEGAESDTAYMSLVKEKRQVAKEMRNILDFLGLRPKGENIVVGYEEL